MATQVHREAAPSNDDPVSKESSSQIVSDHSKTTPTIICFHGSGDDPLPGWEEFVQMARQQYKVVLLDRGTQKISLSANTALLNYLEKQKLRPPYILVAHSYGGAFAKMFLYQKAGMVAGMLLIETGQETGLPDKVEQALWSRTLLDDRPLSVIRGNSLIANWKQLESAEATAQTEFAKEELKQKRKMLESCDLEDERLKKAQLRMSRNTRYVHLPDCGHGVIRDRPDIVLQELQWVMENLQPVATSTSLWSKLRGLWQAPRSLQETSTTV